MRRYVLILTVSALLLSWALLRFADKAEVRAQGNSNAAAAAGQPQQPTGVQSNPGGSVGEQLGMQAGTNPMNCQGCHGQPLPYTAGARVHKVEHAAYEHGYHAKAKQNGSKAATCLDCHSAGGDMSTILPASDPKSTVNRANLAMTCGKCHGDPSVMQGSSISARPFISYQESVHARAISRGNLTAAVCSDCHGGHDILPATDAQSPIFKANIPATCGKCHASISAEFGQSVHGVAVARGVSRSPGCTDCHGIHSIKLPQDPDTAAATQAMATDTCAHCHEGVTLTQEFGVAGQRVSSYQDSYHGMASRLGSKVVANCASCHGVHNILPSSDPRSLINASNLTQTCGQCHPGATQNFASGKVHLDSGDASQDYGSVGTTWVRRIYLPLIFVVIGGMLFHNVLVWRKKAVAKRRHARRTIVRLTRSQRIQHWLLLTSFIALVVSGFALQYPDSGFSWLLGYNEALRRIIHRIAAVVMLVAGLYHLGYLAFTGEGRAWVRDMLPRAKDVRDVVQNFGYYLGLRKSRPKIARFGYAEKAEYWAVVWGTVIMGLTGLMLWFKIGLFGFLPRWWIDIALAIHFYEAVLATLAIVVWHFYHVIFDPDVYPLNWAFYDGREEDELYKEEHGLHYEQLMREREAESEDQPPDSESPETEPAEGPKAEAGDSDGRGN